VKDVVEQKKIQITCTIAQIVDVVQHVGGDAVEVTGLMGQGVDPHLYKASQGDISKLMNADIIFYNGLMLEGRMGDIFVKMARMGKPTIPLSEGVTQDKLREPPEFEGHFDPHIWMDTALWAETVPFVAKELAKLKPEKEAEFKKNAEEYYETLMKLHAENKAKLSTIPKEQRVLVTAHDAFGYFGVAYDVEVMGLQGISTASEFGLQDLQTLIDVIITRKVKAVFVESSVPARSIEALVEGCKAKGHTISIGGELYSDAMGASGTEEGTYVGMIEHNVNTITNALK
jgi:manganese/zinc/iron transport system substrate-binding protein